MTFFVRVSVLIIIIIISINIDKMAHFDGFTILSLANYSSSSVVHGCKSKVGTSDSEQEDFAQEEMCDVENPMFFEQYPELDG